MKRTLLQKANELEKKISHLEQVIIKFCNVSNAFIENLHCNVVEDYGTWEFGLQRDEIDLKKILNLILEECIRQKEKLLIELEEL